MKSTNNCANAKKHVDNIRKCMYIENKVTQMHRKEVMKLYGNLVVAMKLRKITNENIAAALGIHRNSVSNKINGDSKFSIEEAFKIHSVFFSDMNMEELFRKNEEALNYPETADRGA